MFRKKKSRRFSGRNSTRRPKFFSLGRRLRYETMEGRLVLSASGFAGNECAPELNDGGLDAIIPTESFSPSSAIVFQFNAADMVSDAGVGETAAADIRFTLDPDIGSRDNGATPVGATLTLNDQSTADLADDTWDFSWTPSVTQVGTFRLFLIATDDGGTENAVPLSDVYAFSLTVDNRPAVDLNGNDQAGINADAVGFTEADGSAPISIVDSDLFIFSSDGNVESVTIEIASPQADGLEALGITADASLVVDSSTPGKLVITVAGGGSADKSVFEDALRTLTYNNTSNAPETTRTINVTVNDGTATSAIATATVNIQASNDTPDLREVANAPAAKVGEEYLLDLVATDPDGSGELLVFRITSGPAGAVITPNGLPDNSADNTIQVAPDANGLYHAQIRWTPTADEGDVGSATFTVAVTDSGGLADAELYSIGIENQAPVANDDPTAGDDPLAVSEDAGNVVNLSNLFANDTDADGDTFAVNSVTAGGSTFAVGVAFTHPTSGAEILVAANGQVDYNPNNQFETLSAGETATDTFQYTILDERGNESNPATVTVTINGANDAPTVVAGVVPEFRISEVAGATVLDLATLLTAVADVDVNDTLAVAAAPSNPIEGGVFALTVGDLSFDPNGDFLVDNGAEQIVDFMVTIQDSAGESVEIAAKIIIEGANDAPLAVDDPDFTIDEDSVLSQGSRNLGILENDSDDAGNAALVVGEVNGNASNVASTISVADGSGRTGELTVSPNGTFSFDPRGNFDSLAEGESSQVTFTYRASDGDTENGLSNEATVTITITGVNDAPTAANVAVAATENGPTVDNNFGGTDADDGETASLIYNITSLPAEGAVTNNNDGSFTFDPGDDFQDLAEGITREVTFDYTATDAQAAVSDAAIATITITGVNDAPAFDLNNTDGLASTLPTGDLQSASVVAVELDLSSTDANANSLNLVDIPAFTSDIDGDTIGYSLANGENGGTPFRAVNRPVLNASNQLVWVPSAADIGTNYIIRVLATDQPSMGNSLSTSFDLVVSVVAAPSPTVASVTDIDVTLDASEVTILFDKAMGASAFVPGNYSLVALDGSLADTPVPVLIATPVSGNFGVVLQLNDALVDSLAAALAGGTKLRLTLNSSIADTDGNTLAGNLEFDIDLISAAP